MDGPDDIFIADGVPGERHILPSLCFLIQHSERPEKFLFDLGIHPDVTEYPPAVQELVGPIFQVQDSPKCIDALAKGGLAPDDIDYVCLSHIHFDHTGDPYAFKKSTFLVGDGCRALSDDGYPKNPASRVAAPERSPARRPHALSPRRRLNAPRTLPTRVRFFQRRQPLYCRQPGSH